LIRGNSKSNHLGTQGTFNAFLCFFLSVSEPTCARRVRVHPNPNDDDDDDNYYYYYYHYYYFYFFLFFFFYSG